MFACNHPVWHESAVRMMLACTQFCFHTLMCSVLYLEAKPMGLKRIQVWKMLYFCASLKPSVVDWISCRIIEMPYAYQCCVYGSCESYKPASQWDAEQSNTDEDLHKRTVAMYPIHADANCKKTQVCAHCPTIDTLRHETCQSLAECTLRVDRTMHSCGRYHI